MTSRIRSTWAFTGLLLWGLAGCAQSGGPIEGTGGSGTGGAATSGTGGATPGTGGAGTGGAGTGGSGAGGRADGGASDASGADAPSGDTRPADTGAGDLRPADAGGGDTRDGGTDTTVPFAPCPTDGGPCIVMPLGDSITEGYPTFVGGYRVELFHDANINGKNITFVGRRPNGPASGMVDGKPFPTGSEGYSGYTIDTAPGFTGISPLTVPAINMFHPHIILLAIGTNDINNNLNLATAPTRLGALMDTITTAAPNTLLVVAQIIPTRTDATNTRIQAYNAAIPGLVQTRANAGKHVLIVNMYGTYTANANYKTALLVDDLHPTPAGYTLMGLTFYGIIAPFLR